MSNCLARIISNAIPGLTDSHVLRRYYPVGVLPPFAGEGSEMPCFSHMPVFGAHSGLIMVIFSSTWDRCGIWIVFDQPAFIYQAFCRDCVIVKPAVLVSQFLVIRIRNLAMSSLARRRR